MKGGERLPKLDFSVQLDRKREGSSNRRPSFTHGRCTETDILFNAFYVRCTLLLLRRPTAATSASDVAATSAAGATAARRYRSSTLREVFYGIITAKYGQKGESIYSRKRQVIQWGVLVEKRGDLLLSAANDILKIQSYNSKFSVIFAESF